MRKPFVSYAQNFEDVILNRVFKNIKEGFYVDIGAADPLYDSVTKAFYDRGWRGINIDVLPYEIDKFKKQRPGDINLNVGISGIKGQMTLYEYPSCPGWSTLSKETVHNRIKAGVKLKYNEKKINTLPLNDIFNKYCPKKVIHFLKIDVEGFEFEIIEKIDLKKYRPIIIVFEKNRNYKKISWLLKEIGYIFCLFDGLNEFFVRKEDKVLLKFLKYPANCLDNYVPYRQISLEEKVFFLENEIKKIHQEISPRRDIFFLIKKYILK